MHVIVIFSRQITEKGVIASSNDNAYVYKGNPVELYSRQANIGVNLL